MLEYIHSAFLSAVRVDVVFKAFPIQMVTVNQ